MGDNRISVIIPSYNYGRFVAEAIESALSQTYPVDVIVVDDGSTDDTPSRLLPYQSKVRVIRQENRGLSAARNTGIRAATGDWIALLDADDLWHSEKTFRQLEVLKANPSLKLIGSRFFGDMPVGPLAEASVRHLNVRDFLTSTPFGPSSALIHREALDTIGLFDERLTSAEDRDMWLRITARFDAAEVDYPCWFYRSHPDQMSRNAHRMHENYQAMLEKFFDQHPDQIELADEAFAYLYIDSTLCHLEQHDRIRALGFLIQSFRRWPRPLIVPGRSTRYWRAKLLTRVVLGEGFFGRATARMRFWRGKTIGNQSPK